MTAKQRRIAEEKIVNRLAEVFWSPKFEDDEKGAEMEMASIEKAYRTYLKTFATPPKDPKGLWNILTESALERAQQQLRRLLRHKDGRTLRALAKKIRVA